MQAIYQVKLDGFEGPLDLLLHLVNRYEIDIYDIPVAEITEQYMNYIHTMQQLELNLASEYLVMAATLLAIKSSLLLPNQELDEEDDNFEEDPREELINRLVEYRKYKQAADQLKEKEQDEQWSYIRPPEKVIFTDEEKRISMKGNGNIYDMLAAMQKVFERRKWNLPLETTIERIDIPIKQRMDEVLQLVNKSGQKGINFDQLFQSPNRSYIVATFMAVLELMKDDLIYCSQERSFDQIIIFNREGK